jgi:HD-GYP domain-containing protein (c-di-GMP phosphodiesterase class II)
MVKLWDSAASYIDFGLALGEVVDLVSPELARHHAKVASLAFRVAEEMGLPSEECREIMLAGALHDIGALSAAERVALLEFEARAPLRHAIAGAELLAGLAPLAGVSEIVRHHHLPWHFGKGRAFVGRAVPVGAHVLHLADRAVVLVDGQSHVLSQVKQVADRISAQAGSRFHPDVVEAFRRVAEREAVWLSLETSNGLSALAGSEAGGWIAWPRIEAFAETVAALIDFRSRFTATHSCGVAAVAATLARAAGFKRKSVSRMRVAGLLHDVGKLAVPTEIIEKPGSLAPLERSCIRAHSFHTHVALSRVPSLRRIRDWASSHHERLDGLGYPSRRPGGELDEGCRILAVADVFTALTEERPYRDGMDEAAARRAIDGFVDGGALAPEVVDLLAGRFDELNEERERAQRTARQQYEEFHRTLAHRVERARQEGADRFGMTFATPE